MSDERRILPFAIQAFYAGALILISLGSSQVTEANSLQRPPPPPPPSPPPNRVWPVGTRPPPTYIIGGTPADPCKWRWHVALLKEDGSFFCGATLISNNWVLTAGHCLHGKPPEVPIYAALGAHNLSANDAAQRILIGTVVVHAAFNPDDYGVNDLALLELTEPANTSHPCIEAIELGSSNFDPVTNDDCWMVGWGRYSYDEDDYSEIPLETRATVIKNTNCQWRWSTSIFFQPTIYSSNVCTFDRQNYTSACDWDSGSPLQCFDDTHNGGSWVLVGIHSWGSGGCMVYPSVFMRASNYTAWILMNVFRLNAEPTTTPPPPGFP